MALTMNEYKRQFMASEAAVLAKRQLESMVGDTAYNTKSSYTPFHSEDVSFVDKHLLYLSEHPKLSTQAYLANLRLMTKKRD